MARMRHTIKCSAMSVIWPLFDIRITTPRLELRLPTEADLQQLAEVALQGIHPPETMPFGAPWTDAAPDDLRRSMLQHHWEKQGVWSPDAWDLSLAIFIDGQPAGFQSIRTKQFPILRSVDSGSWLGNAWQGRGFGTDMREAVLHFAFDTLGALTATSHAFDDNDVSVAVSEKVGYRPDGEDFWVSQGKRRRSLRYRISREQWLERRRDDKVGS